ncbi:MAG: M28 family peptidase [Alphaproteobacteria bacterium]
MEMEVDERRLRRILEAIVGERNPFSAQRHLAEVESFIEVELQSYGIAVESDYFFYHGRRFRNIIGEIGNPRSGSLVILGAHFDSVAGAPGADDNGSGVAVLLESARILAQSPLRSRLLICAFNLEELNMIGSTHLARKLKATGTSMKAMISLEMVGYADSTPGSQRYPAGLRWFYPDRGDFIGVIGNFKSISLLRRVARLMRQSPGLAVETLAVPGKGELIPAVRLSDHAPFWDLGCPALMITDTAFFRNPHYHSPSDTLDTLNIDFMAKVCQGIICALVKA